MKNLLSLETFVLLLIGLCAAALIYGGIQKRSPEAYAAWCKLERRTDLSYEDWLAARSAGLIKDSDTSSTVVVPIYSR